MAKAKKSPKKIALGAKARTEFSSMQMQVNTFMQGVRSALNVPDDWVFDAQAMAFVERADAEE